MPDDAATPRARDDLPELTSLRFVAAFGVLLLHYRDLLGPVPAWLMPGIVGGQHGVTFFFVLSGFILTYRYDGWFRAGVSDAGYWTFLRLRLARLYPVYVLGLLLDTPWHLIERVQAGQLAASGMTYWASWLLNLVGLQAWVPAVPYAMFWNAPAWSVSAEFFFYATFPFVCAALGRRGAGESRRVLGIVAVTLAGILLYAGVAYAMNYVVRAPDPFQYIVLVYNPLLRWSEFLAGCLAGQAFLAGGAFCARLAAPDAAGRRLRDGLVAASLAVVALRVWMPGYSGPSAGWWLLDVSVRYGVFIVPFAAIIVAVASGRTFLSPLLALPVMVLLGEASYSLYILHWSGTTVLRMGHLGSPPAPAVGALMLVATVAASVWCYRAFERPWRRRLRGEAGRPAVFRRPALEP